MTARTSEEDRRNRRRFLLLIVLVVAGLNVLWGISVLVNRLAGPGTPGPVSEKGVGERPADVIGRMEYKIDKAEQFANEGRFERAFDYVRKIGQDMDTIRGETLRPAERYRMEKVQERFSVLKEQLSNIIEGAPH